jgi:DNA-binding transcriptional ArsR family regulator
MKTYSHPPLREISLDRVMHSLSDPCRVAIVRALLQSHGQELACNDIVLAVSKATRSHHFDVLRDAGLIRTRVEGTKCMTSLRTTELEKRFPGLLHLVLSSGEAAG